MDTPTGCGCGGSHHELDEIAALPGHGEWLASATITRRRAITTGLVAASAVALGTRFASRAAAISVDPSDRSYGRAAGARTLLPPPSVVSRSQWGADERLRTQLPLYDAVIDKLIVHHTVTPTNPSNPAYWVNQIYQYELANGYIDVAYHWLIDQNGRIYEGRWSRDRAAGEVVDGEDALARNVRGGATLGHNPRTIAVAMLGDFSSQLPTAAALDALATVLAWKAARWGLVPTARSVYRKADGTTNLLPNVSGHRQCSPTACPGLPLLNYLPTLSQRAALKIAAGGRGGLWVAHRNGTVLARGDAVPTARRPASATREVGGAVHVPNAHGVWLFGPDGGVFAFGDARFYGSAFGRRLRAPIRAMAATPTGDGYWLAGADGGVFALGDARFHGAASRAPLDAPIVGMAVTPDGDGYWLAGADGGVFSFGAARYFGDATRRARRPVVDILATERGDGYALLTDDGTVLAFGAAPDHAATDVGQATGAIALAGRLGAPR